MEFINEIIKSIIPVRFEVVWGTITGAIGMVTTYLFGEWNSVAEGVVWRW
jgi:hypothetical protein